MARASRRKHTSLVALFVAAFSTLWLMPTQSAAQYFGRNKVKYESFQIKILRTPHFDIHFYPQEQIPTVDGARMAERWYYRFSRLMNHSFKEKKPILFYADQPDFQQTNAIFGALSEGTGGVTEPLKDRVILPFTGLYQENDHVLGHELVHAFQYDIAMSDTNLGLAAMQRVPLWMVEGLAEYLSLGSRNPHTAMWMRDAIIYKKLPTIRDLATKPEYFPYRWGQALYAFIGGAWSDTTVISFFKTALAMGPDSAIIHTLKMTPDSLGRLWHAALKATYLDAINQRVLPGKQGRKILGRDIQGGEMNLGPAISPDGNEIAFISERNIFSLDLFVTDAETGKHTRKVTSSERNFHFDAISFVNAAGAWSPDGKRLAIIAYDKGDNEIVILNAENGKIENELHWDDIGAILHVAWSPDGNTLAFSGQVGGISDLFLYDLQTNTLTRLTNDRYAQMQPAWSPDGRYLAFITDLGPATDFDLLSHGDVQIAIWDLERGEYQVLPLFPNGKHINPQFSPDGNSLFFISDPDGFANIYRLDLVENRIYRVTNFATGVSGLTRYSPALSVASRAGRMVFTVYENGAYNGYILEPRELVGEPVLDVPGGFPIAGMLPPAYRVPRRIVNLYLTDFVSGLPTQKVFPIEAYHSRLKLDYLGGQASAGIMGNRYGTLIGGGIFALFSDMMGDRMLAVTLQANGRIQDIGGQVYYENRATRWVKGYFAGHIPYVSVYQTQQPVLIDVGGGSVPGIEVLTLYDRTFIEQGGMVFKYPLSTTHRFEITPYLTHTWFRSEIEQLLVINNQVVSRKVQKLPSPSPYTLFQLSGAFVGDYSYFGFTSPTAGGRYRFEAEGIMGTLNFFTLLADYRRYIFLKPFTLAFRFLHYGRYGPDSDSRRITPLFIGYPTLVRGYSSGSFSYQECIASGGNGQDCPAINRLAGSRFAVINAEFRIPLIGTRRFGLINFGFLPTEVSFYFDGGVAWTADQSPVLKWATNSTQRIPVFSTGVSFRINLLGYAIIEIYGAHPFQRPQKDWLWGFNLAPGW